MSKTAKLSDRALILLHLVDKDTDCDWATGELKGFFVPAAQTGYSYFVNFRGKSFATDVASGGDASAFRGLEAKGLIKRPKTNLPMKYIYAITEAGRLVMEENRELFE